MVDIVDLKSAGNGSTRASSSLAACTKYGGVAEWVMATVLKTVCVMSARRFKTYRPRQKIVVDKEGQPCYNIGVELLAPT